MSTVEKSTIENENNIEKSTSALGNTKLKQTSTFFKGRAFQLTLWKIEKYEEIKEYLIKSKNFRYLLAAKETGELSEEKEHIHIYINYRVASKIVVSKLHSAHVEVCRGTPQENIAYVSKQGNIIDEIGDKPKKGGCFIIKDAKNMTNDQLEELPLQYYQIAERIKEKNNNRLSIGNWHKPKKVIYFFGESGAGKSLNTSKFIEKWYQEKGITDVNKMYFDSLKFDGKFWSGITDDCKVAVFDEFRDSSMKPENLLNLIDYNKCNLRTLFGNKMNEYELVILNSIFDPRKLYKNLDDEPRKQWLRRMEIYEVKKGKEPWKINIDLE